MNETQIQTMASKPDYALIKSSADELEPLSTEVLRYTCEGKCRILTFVMSWQTNLFGNSNVNCNGIARMSMNEKTRMSLYRYTSKRSPFNRSI